MLVKMKVPTIKCIRFRYLFGLLSIISNFVLVQNESSPDIVNNQNNLLSQKQRQQKTQIFIPSQFELTALESEKRNHAIGRVNDFCQLKDVESVFIGPMAASFVPSFILFNKSMRETRLVNSASAKSIKKAGFDAKKSTLLLVHGHDELYPNTTWLHESRDLFKKNSAGELYNLIIMDWGQHASQGDYFLVAKRAKGMGIYLAEFLNKIFNNFNYDRMRIHIIGHSLGAHVAGFAGKLINPKIGRITGIDLAGPCFGKVFNEQESNRLASTDALQLVVLHYDDGFLGLPGQYGQVDVYVNGGREQPGTSGDISSILRGLSILITKSNDTLSYSHTRSTKVATMQLDGLDCQHVAYECEDYKKFLMGECGSCDKQNDQCLLIDLPFQFDVTNKKTQLSFNISSHARGKKLFVNTGTELDLCLHHFQILVKTKPVDELLNLAAKIGMVYLDLELTRNDGAELEFNKLTMNHQMEPGIYSHLLLMSTQQRQPFNEARLKMHPPLGQFPKPPFDVLSIEINYMSNIDPIERLRRSSRLCPRGKPDPNNWIQLSPCSLMDRLI